MDQGHSPGCGAACPAPCPWQSPREPSPVAGSYGCSAVPSVHSAPGRIWLSQRWQLHPDGFISPQEDDHWPGWVVTAAGRVRGLQPSLSPLPPSPHPVGFRRIPGDGHGAAGMLLPGSPPSAGSNPATWP